jgi:hypothetical protein
MRNVENGEQVGILKEMIMDYYRGKLQHLGKPPRKPHDSRN